MKILKVIIVIIIGFIMLTIIFAAIIGFKNIDKDYGEKMFRYRTNQICIECFNGSRKDVCPKLPSDSEIKYPFAKEYAGETDNIVDMSDYNDENIIKNQSCESWHKNLTMTEKEPVKSYKESFVKAWRGSFDVISVGLCILIPNCSM